MVEAPVMAGSRSAATSPAQSPSRAYARLQQKAQALAADLDSKLSVALKARQALPAPSWRPEEVPKRQSLPPGAVPLKAVLESEATPPAEVPKQPKQPTQPVPSPANHTPRIQALESRLEELVEKLQLEQSARKGFEQDLQKKLQVSADSAVQKVFQALEANGGNAEARAAVELMKEDVNFLRTAFEEKVTSNQEALANACDGIADLQNRMASCEAANKNLEQKRQRKELEGPALVQMVTTSEEQVQLLRQELVALDRRLSQAANDQSEAFQVTITSVKKEIDSLSKAKSDVERACQEHVLALTGSYAEVKKDMSALEETWAVRISDVKSSQDILKSILIKDVEEVKPWQRDMAQLREELSQQIQESANELSKSIVACQGRLSSARLDTHEKVQGLEERLTHAEKRSSEAKAAWLNGEPALKQVQAALKEVAELRDFTMDQSSKLQNNVQAELSNLESKVLRECDATREFCNEQKQQVGEIHDQLRLELKEAVSNARGVAEELAQELLRLKQQSQDSTLAKQIEELKEKLVNDLLACEARLHAEESSIRQFTSEQAAQLRIAVEDLQVAVEKLQKGRTNSQELQEPKAVQVVEPELSLEEVKQFETVRMTKVLSEGKATESGSLSERLGPRDAQRSQGRQQRQELLQRLSEAESRLQQQHGLVQKQKEHLESMRKS